MIASLLFFVSQLNLNTKRSQWTIFILFSRCAISFYNEPKEIIVEYGGIVKTVELWGKKRLIYGDAGISEGIYGLMKISIEREATPKVNQKLKGIEELLRYMLIRMEL